MVLDITTEMSLFTTTARLVILRWLSKLTTKARWGKFPISNFVGGRRSHVRIAPIDPVYNALFSIKMSVASECLYTKRVASSLRIACAKRACLCTLQSCNET
jgi:hypothetical protein